MTVDLYSTKVSAGFPSPAEDYLAESLDLNTHLVKHPAATFFVRVISNTLQEINIRENDILVVDRSLTPSHGKLVIAAIYGKLSIRKLHQQKEALQLLPIIPSESAVNIGECEDIYIWGTITHIIHSV